MRRQGVDASLLIMLAYKAEGILVSAPSLIEG